MKYRTYVLVVCLLGLIILEVLIRVTGKMDTYAESIGHRYSSYYNIVLPKWYHSWLPNDTFELNHGDFKYPYITNSFGMREKEVVAEKPDTVFRIITLGDSYTEGVGAPYDSSWPHLLPSFLNNPKPVEIINAGQSGSDPFYDYVFYRDKLNAFQPDLVIASFNSSDFTDYVLRGGMERFHNDGTVHFARGPWYEPLYKYSHLIRVLMKVLKHPYKGIFISSKNLGKATEIALTQYAVIFDSLNNMVGKSNGLLVVLVYPTPTEIVFQSATNLSALNSMDRLCNELNAHGIVCLNMNSEFKSMYGPLEESVYTYKNDKHFTPYGYQLMAGLVAAKLNSLLKSPQ